MQRGETNAPLFVVASRAAFDWWERAGSSRTATAVVFLWSVSEATVWPIIADFALVPVVVANRRKPHIPLLTAIAGMALGGVATLFAARRWPAWALSFVVRLPLVEKGEVKEVGRRLAVRGARAFLTQPWSGVPYKVWGAVAGARGLPLRRVIPAFVFARALRLTISAGLTVFVARMFTRLLRDGWLLVAPAYVGAFAFGLWRLQRGRKG